MATATATTTKKLFESGRLSELDDTEAMTRMSKDELVDIIKRVKSEFEKFKSDAVQFESELRSELVGKWSKRVEDSQAYYE